MLSRTILALTAIAGCAVAQQAPGIQASMSSDGANYILGQLLPVVEAKVMAMTIADISGESNGFDYSVSNIACSDFSVGTYQIAFVSPNQLSLTLGDISASINAGWSFRLHIWPHIPDGSGSVAISVSSTTATVSIDLGADGNFHPTVSAGPISLNIGDISMSFSGSLWDWLLDLFKGLIKNAITSGLQNNFGSIVGGFINNDLNTVLQSIPIAIPVGAKAPYDIAEARFGLTAAPSVTSTYIGLPIQGDIVPIANPVTPPIAPPSLPPFGGINGNYYLQAQLSAYTLLSGVYTYYNAGLLSKDVASDKIPLGLNTTAAYSLIAPGFASAYPGGAVSLTIKASTMPNIAMSSTGGISLFFPSEIDFNVTPTGGSTPVFAFNIMANVSIALSLQCQPDPSDPTSGVVALTGSIQYLSASLSSGKSNVGPVTVSLLQGLIDTAFSTIIVPIANGVLAAGIPLPSTPGLAITNASIVTADDAVILSLDFTYTPQLSSVFAGIQKKVTKSLPKGELIILEWNPEMYAQYADVAGSVDNVKLTADEEALLVAAPEKKVIRGDNDLTPEEEALIERPQKVGKKGKKRVLGDKEAKPAAPQSGAAPAAKDAHPPRDVNGVKPKGERAGHPHGGKRSLRSN